MHTYDRGPLSFRHSFLILKLFEAESPASNPADVARCAVPVAGASFSRSPCEGRCPGFQRVDASTGVVAATACFEWISCLRALAAC